MIDTTYGVRRSGLDVYVIGDRIAALRPVSEADIGRAGFEILDGRGKFLIPGLWDMHAHWFDRTSLPLFTLNGVTGIRQMRGYTSHSAWRSAGIEGTVASPRVVLASPLVDGTPPTWRPSLAADTPEHARAVVRLVAASNADFLKVYDKVPVEVYRALTEEARRLGVRVEGHVPADVSWQDAADIGVQRSFEHVLGLSASVADHAEAFRPRWTRFNAEIDADASLTPEQRRTQTALLDEAMAHFDAARFADLASMLARHRVWQTPTLVMWEARVRKFDSELQHDARLQLLSGWMRDYWNESIPALDRTTSDEIAMNRRRHAFNLARVGELHAAGVPLLAGSDTVIPYVFPGTALHEELALLVQAGLSPLAALQTATLNPAQFLGRDDLGVIREGALADMVLLDADPLDEIANTQRIHSVVIGGALIDPAARERGFAALERIAHAPGAVESIVAASKEGGIDAAMAAYHAQCPASPEIRHCDAAAVIYRLDEGAGRGP